MTYVKICGVRSVAEARAARDAGADLIGVVFAESRRRVSVETAHEIVSALRPDAPTEIECSGGLQSSRRLEHLMAFKRPLFVGVFEGQTAAVVESIAERAGIDVLQLHGEDAPVDELVGRWPVIQAIEPGARISHNMRGRDWKVSATGVIGSVRRDWKAAATGVIGSVRRDWKAAATGVIGSVRRDWKVSATGVLGGVHVGSGVLYMFDGSRGRGRLGDWDAIAALASRVPLMLAGGLMPDNVAEAIERVRPWGVDVSSGVETDGRKDATKMRAFVAAAKAAQ